VGMVQRIKRTLMAGSELVTEGWPR
jgi:hypothetical protein